MVNGHKADIPSMLLKPGDVVTVEKFAQEDLLERSC
jgi:ribosomal protein S4